jgi:radical SAM superfamily enzyme YgiQ (UPF0313 family)
MNRHKTPVYSVYNSCGHSPLALGMILSYAKSYKGGDLTNTYEFISMPLGSVEHAREAIGTYGSGILLCSDYLWTSQQNLELARLVKEWYPDTITVHGGPSVPKYDYSCESFFAAHPCVDIAVRGEGEVTTSELLEQLAIHADEFCYDRRFLSNVAGLTYRTSTNCGSDKILRTADRERIRDLDNLPSPYLTGWFRTEDAETWVAAIIETNRGCPYGCTFCDWGSATLSKVRQFALDRIQGELEWIAKQGVGVLWIADANFGMLSRDVEIAEMIASCSRTHGYPKQVVVNYAKHATERLAEIIRIFNAAGIAAGGIISIQTQDTKTLQNIRRSNIKTERYEELLEIFRQRNLPVTSDLMIGLPGATIESFKADLQFFFDRKIYAHAYPTMVLPNSPMAHREYMEKYRIVTDSEGYIVSTYSYTLSDRSRMQRIYLYYNVLFGFSVLKYFLYYLQVDHGVQALALIDDLQSQLSQNPTSMPKTWSLIRSLMALGGRSWIGTLQRREACEWSSFYGEVAEFVTRKYGILDAAMNTVLFIQAKLLPERGRKFPEVIDLSYDFATYFQAIQSVRALSEFKGSAPKPLSEYGPGRLEITDPRGLCEGSLDEKVEYGRHRIQWELTSTLLSGEGVYHVVDPEKDGEFR